MDDATTFRFAVTGHPRHLDWPSQQQVIARVMGCAHLPFQTKGRVSLKAAQRTFRVFLVFPDHAPESAPIAAYLLEEARRTCAHAPASEPTTR